MAKQKTCTIGIIVVVGFIVFIMALGGGFFKNFAIQGTNDGSQGVATVTIFCSTGHGTTNPAIGAHQVNISSTLNIEAIPAQGYHLDYWTWNYGNGASPTVQNATSTTLSLTITGDITVNAFFAQGSSNNKSLVQQIIDWFASIWQSILEFLRGFGINI